MGTTAYIANNGNSLYQCTIDSATGVFSACSIINGAGNSYLHGMAVYGQWLYVASGLNAPIGLAVSANKVSKCVFGPGGTPTNCTTATTALNGLNNVAGIVASGGYIYLTQP